MKALKAHQRYIPTEEYQKHMDAKRKEREILASLPPDRRADYLQQKRAFIRQIIRLALAKQMMKKEKAEDESEHS